MTDDEEGDGEPMVDEKFPPSPPRFWTPLASFIGGAGKEIRKWGGLLGQSSPIRRLFTPTFRRGGWAKEVWPDLPGLDGDNIWGLPEELKVEEFCEQPLRVKVCPDATKKKQPTVWNKKKRKHMLKLAMGKAKELGEDTKKVTEFKKKFSAKSSWKPQVARRKTIAGIAKSLGKETCAGKKWNPVSFTKLGTVLKDSGYKSAKIYLAEAKLMHVEAGGVWDQQMVRVHQQVKRAVERSKGKTKRAAEVPAHLWVTDPPEKKPEGNSSKRVSARRANLAFVLGVHWMLREAELVELTPEDITLDMGKKLAKVTLRSSKMDQAGETVSRILQCSCGEMCSSNKQCPYFVAWEIVTCCKAEELRPVKDKRWLVASPSGKRISKAGLIKKWQGMYGEEVSGHSARRSGALRYIRAGWQLAQVAFLGRWSSNVIYQYAQEELAVNGGHGTWEVKKSVFETPSLSQLLGGGGEKSKALAIEDTNPPDWAERLRGEMEVVKQQGEKDSEAFKEMAKTWEECMANREGKLPEFVRSLKSGTTHVNVTRCPWSPATTWRTRCGWQFGASGFTFVEKGEESLCAKCATFSHRAEQEG